MEKDINKESRKDEGLTFEGDGEQEEKRRSLETTLIKSIQELENIKSKQVSLWKDEDAKIHQKIDNVIEEVTKSIKTLSKIMEDTDKKLGVLENKINITNIKLRSSEREIGGGVGSNKIRSKKIEDKKDRTKVNENGESKIKDTKELDWK